MREVGTAALVAGHLFLGVGWFGAMAYSLFVLQPKAAGYFAADDEAHEHFLTTVAHGQRWKVVGLLAALAGTGAGLVLLAGSRTAAWWAVVAVKAVLLAVAGAVFWRCPGGTGRPGCSRCRRSARPSGAGSGSPR